MSAEMAAAAKRVSEVVPSCRESTPTLPHSLPVLVHPSSAARGVTLPLTPASIDPLPLDLAPNTERDSRLAIRAERRRVLTVTSIALLVISIAIGGYLAGRSAPPNAHTPSAPPPVASTLPPKPSAAPEPTMTSVPTSSLPEAPPLETLRSP